MQNMKINIDNGGKSVYLLWENIWMLLPWCVLVLYCFLR